MGTEYRVVMTSVIGTGLCSASDDGDKVYAEIAKLLKAQHKINLSFEGVQDLTTAFLNAAVGRLYNGDYDYQFLAAHLLPVETTNEDLHALKRVVVRAKDFFKDPERFQEADKEAFSNGN